LREILAALLLAAVSQTQTFTAVKTAVAPSFAVVPGEGAWKAALRASDFMNFTARQPAAYETTAYLLYDDRNLYVAFHCVQHGTPLTATQRLDHAGVGSDDHVGFGIDTSGNGARTYTFRVNPLGVHDESSTENARYAPPWRSIARADANGNYDVFMQIPLRDVRASGGTQRWRFNFERYVAASDADLTWAYDPAMQSISAVQFWPVLAGVTLRSSATRPTPRADAYLLGSAGPQHDEFQNGIGQFQAMHPRAAGVDVTYPLTNTLALVGTIEPDFSNVEEDQTTIELQEFQKSYNEYRPFFSQGAQYIDAVPQIGLFGGNSLFYSPSIGVFDSGVKVEGTAGNNALGVLHVAGPGIEDTAAGYSYSLDNGALTFSGQSVLARHPDVRDGVTGFGMTRLNRQSGEQTQIEFASEENSLGGSGHDFNISEGLQNQHFTALAFYRDTSAAYSPIDGYTATPDARGPIFKLGYSATGGRSSPLLAYSFNFFGDRYLAADGSVREADLNLFYNVHFKNLISLQGFFGPSELQNAPGRIEWFNRRQIQLGYRQSTPSFVTATYAWGPFAGGYVQQTQLVVAKTAGPYVAELEYDGNLERPFAGAPPSDSQWLRRLSLSRAFGSNASFGLQLRSINGRGGFALPGTDLSFLYQERFADQNLLYVEFGTPAAPQTLHRYIVKYVFHAGGGTGT
jgi:hypothetical protein